MTTTAFDAERLEALRARFSGPLLGPGDEGYDEARRVHNGLIDRRPALIARCRSAADVAAAIKARGRGGARGLGARRRAQRRRPGGDRRRA